MHGPLLADAVDYGRNNFKQYLRGFDDSNYTTQAPGMPNHVAWTLGHLALVINRAAEKLDGAPLPASDFITGAASERRCFDTETICFGSTPSPDVSMFPHFDRGVAIFDAAADRLIEALRVTTDAKLDEVVRWGNRQMTIRDIAIRMVFHMGVHAGEIADLRRVMKMGSIFA